MPMWKSMDSVDLAGRACSEDRFGTSGAMAWILDGASSVSDGTPVTEAGSDATWIVEHLDRALRSLAGDPAPLNDLVAEAIGQTAALVDREWSGPPEVLPSAALGVVRHAGDHTEFLVLADVSVILRPEAGAQWFIDRRLDVHNKPAADAMEQALRDRAVTFEQARERTKPYLAKPRQSAMNKPGGYWVASIDAAAAGHALTGTVDGAEDVILASDGFMRALDLFGLVPDADALFERDFEDLAEQIRRVEHDDADTRRYPRWSVSDDICAHRLQWVGE
jgi:hypothetical protein